MGKLGCSFSVPDREGEPSTQVSQIPQARARCWARAGSSRAHPCRGFAPCDFCPVHKYFLGIKSLSPPNLQR